MEAIIVLVIVAGFFVFWLLLKMRNIHIWFISYLKQQLFKKTNHLGDGQHIYLCLADHYEPYFGDADRNEAHDLVLRWVTEYRRLASRHTDSDGRHPQHSYFYPVEEYDEWVLDQLKEICADGFGDVDIHLHHDGDTAENLAQTLNSFTALLFDRHQLLRKDESGKIVYGFIHGNWALDNSRPDGKWCGVDNEIDVLIDTGCVFDMTMPSAPSDTQTSMTNSIYFARDDGRPKSHNKGRRASTGQWGNERELLMIQGPLTLNWGKRKFGLLPKIENGELSSDAPPNKLRIKLWENCAVTIEGIENHTFIKLYTHGLQKDNMEMFFDLDGFEQLWTSLENEFKDSEDYRLHYVTAWEMYTTIKSICLAKPL